MSLFSDIVLYNGKIYTLDKKERIASALAVRDCKIALVGDDFQVLETIGPQTKVIDLSGRVVLPGFIDTHIHPSMAGEFEFGRINLKSIKYDSIPSLQEVFREIADDLKVGEWIVGWGFDEEHLIERRYPSKDDLDPVTPENPVLMSHACGHIAFSNTLALEIAGISRKSLDPARGLIDRDYDGEPTGILKNRAIELVKKHVPELEFRDFKEGLRLACNRLASWGLTTIHDAWSTPQLLRAYQELDEESLLPIRVGLLPPIANPFEGDYLQELTTLGIRTGFGSRKLRINGVKIALDGMIRSRTAALQESYQGEAENYGLVTVDIEEFREKVSKSHNEGLRVCIHAEGDRGLDIALNAIERAQDGKPVPDPRHRIEHFGLCKPYQIEIMKRLGVIPSVSINLVYEIGEGYKEALGEERCKYLYPLRSLFEEGIRASCNSDWPVSNGNPLSGIYSAVNRETWKGTKLGINQKISLIEAIKAYTINGAYASFEEEHKGSLEEGKLADLVVLSDDIFEIQIKEIPELRIDLTMVDGKIVYER